MVLGKKVAIFHWEWGQNSALRDVGGINLRESAWFHEHF